ncbi:MAG: hypothetical protein Kow0088_15490 [Anaerolineales bacterium]
MDFLLDEVVLIDSRGEILWVNQAWRDFAQKNNAAENVCIGIGLNYYAVCRQASQSGDRLAKETLEGLLAVSQGRKPDFTMEYPCSTPQGELWFRMRAIRLGGKDAPLIITHHNISERIEAEKAYQAESDRFFSLINSMADIVFLLDTEGRHVGVYGQWLEGYKVSAEMFLGKTAREILGDEAARVHEEANQRVLQGENVLYEWSFQDENGEHIIQTHLSPLRTREGKIHGIVGVGRDLTNRIKAERLYAEQAQNLSRLNELATHLQSLQSAPEVFTYLTHQVADLLQAEKVLIAVRDLTTNLLEAQAPAYGFDIQELERFRISVSEGQKVWDFDLQGSILANRIENLPDEFRKLAHQFNVHSVLAVQVDLKEHMGGLILAANKAHGFSDKDRQMLELVAQQASGVLSRLQLLQRLEDRLNELQVLHLVSACSVQAETDDELIREVTQIVGNTLYPDNFGVLLLDEREGVLKAHPSYHGATSLGMNSVYPLGKGSLSGMVAQSGQPLRIDDVTQEENYFPANPATRSELCVPLRVGKDILGVLNVESNRKAAFKQSDQQLLTTIADLLASAILRLRRAAAERRALGIAESLVKTARSLNSELELESVLQRIFESLESLLPYQSATIIWLEKEQYLKILHKGQSVAPDNSWLKFAKEFLEKDNFNPILIQIDLAGNISVCEETNSLTPCKGIVTQLLSRNKPFGILALEGLPNLKFDEELLELVSVFGDQAALSLHNASLYSQAKRDAERRAALHEASQKLIKAGYDFETMYSTLHRAIASVMPAEAVVISLQDKGNQKIMVEYAIDRGGRIPKQVIPAGKGLSGWVINHGNSLKIDDVTQEPQIKEIALHFGSDEPIRSLIAVPLLHQQEVLGMISAQSYSPCAYTEEDVKWLEMLAANAAGLIQNAYLYEGSRQRLRELEAINNVSISMRNAFTSDEMLSILLSETTKLFGSGAGSAWTFDPVLMKLIPRVVSGWFQEIQQEPLYPNEGLVGWVFTHGETLVTTEFVKDERATESFRLQSRAGWYGIIMPIKAADEVLGALALAFPTARTLHEDEIKLLSAFCEIAGNAFQRAQATEQLERRVQQLLSLRTIDNAINSSLDIGLTLDILLEQVLSHVSGEAADILLFDPRTYSLKMVAQRGYRSLTMNPLSVPVTNGILVQILNERQLQLITDLSGITIDSTRQSLFKAEGFRSYVGIPLLAKGQMVGILEIFRRSPKLVPPEELEFLETLAGQAAIAIDNATLFFDLQQTNTQLSLAYDSTLEGWARALELRDNETEGHSRRVTDMTIKLAQLLGVPESEWIHIRRGSLLHDIGKMGISDKILHKAGPLTEAEWEIMKQHPVFAYHLLQPIHFLQKALDIPYCHHEHWDGSGYPQGLRGEQIPLAARIFAVVDVYDALCSDRPYRKAWSKEAALAYVKDQAGKLFDPRVVEAFLEMIP